MLGSPEFLVLYSCFNQGGRKSDCSSSLTTPHWTKEQTPPKFISSHSQSLNLNYLLYNYCASPHFPFEATMKSMIFTIIEVTI